MNWKFYSDYARLEFTLRWSRRMQSVGVLTALITAKSRRQKADACESFQAYFGGEDVLRRAIAETDYAARFVAAMLRRTGKSQ